MIGSYDNYDLAGYNAGIKHTTAHIFDIVKEHTYYRQCACAIFERMWFALHPFLVTSDFEYMLENFNDLSEEGERLLLEAAYKAEIPKFPEPLPTSLFTRIIDWLKNIFLNNREELEL